MMGDVALYLVLLNFNRCVQVGKTLQTLLDLRFTLTKGVPPQYIPFVLLNMLNTLERQGWEGRDIWIISLDNLKVPNMMN